MKFQCFRTKFRFGGNSGKLKSINGKIKGRIGRVMGGDRVEGEEIRNKREGEKCGETKLQYFT